MKEDEGVKRRKKRRKEWEVEEGRKIGDKEKEEKEEMEGNTKKGHEKC